MVKPSKTKTVDVIDEAAADFLGFIDVINDQQISGWCCNKTNFLQRVTLELIFNDEVVGVALCNLIRDDLKDLGIGDGMHGFNWTPLITNYKNLEYLDVKARILGTEIYLDNIATHTKSSGVVAPISLITIDSVFASGIAGWVKDDGSCNELTIELLLDGQLHSNYLANIMRIDVQESGIDSGRFGFLIPMPSLCFGDHKQTISLHIPQLGETIHLTGEQCELDFFSSGNFQIEDGIINGRISTKNIPTECEGLEFFADDKLIGTLPFSRPLNLQLIFQFELPISLCDSHDHQIAVSLANSKFRIKAVDGSAASVFRRNIKGKIDDINETGVVGWVYSLEDKDSKIEVEIYDGSILLGSVETSILRSDVNKSFNLTGPHGFHFYFQEYLFDDTAHHIRVVYKGETLNRKQSLQFPITLAAKNIAQIAPATRYEGCIDSISTERIIGWACDRLNPTAPLHISIYVDDKLVGETYANRFAARLRSGQRDGHHVFFLDLPVSLMNGRGRTVRALVTEAGFEIPSSTKQVLFPLVDLFGKPASVIKSGNFSYVPPQLSCTAAAVASEQLLAVLPHDAPLISIIILNWNGAAILRECLESFVRVKWRYSYELILVDHGSTDASLEVVREFEKILPLRLIARGANYSFSASNNMAAKLAKGKFLAFANNDLVMLHDCFATMLMHFSDSTVGAVGLKLLEPIKGRDQQWHYITHHQGVQMAVGGVLPDSKQRYYTAMEIGEKPIADLAAAYHLPISTGALLVCQANDFAAIGGFFEGYFYGMEDVDLCLAITLDMGKKVICDTAAVALHNRSATRDSKLRISDKEKMYNAKIHAKNRRLYIERFGRRLTRQVLSSLVQGDHFWRPKPLRVSFIVTETSINTAAGDLFTALELAEAMRRLFGWEVLFGRMDTYSLPGTDVLVVMRHDYNIQNIIDANPGLVTVAWARNRMDEWVASPYFDAYQLIFCSSQKSIEYVWQKSGRDSILLPIATNAHRFAPSPPDAQHLSDLTFTGSYWHAQREAIGLQNLSNSTYEFAIYGYQWDACPEWAAHWRGSVSYQSMPTIYNSAKIVLDDSHPVTREWNSLNSRVFDALGCGRLVLTNCVGGANEVFSDLLPSFTSADELQALVNHYLAHPDEREALATKLHEEVLAKHTYDNRAHTFRNALVQVLQTRLRFAIKIGVPKAEERESWGDYHFALGIKHALEKQGHYARIDLLPDWESGFVVGDDVVIVLRGLSQYKPQPTAINLMWLISHPDDVKISEYQQYDHVFVASNSFAQYLSGRLEGKVSSLLQCTDPTLFYKDVTEDLEIADVLFVGNSRGQRRPAVQYALESDLDFCVYGELWEGMLPPSRVRGVHIPNQVLRQYYSSAKVVLNDHWPDMRSEGFISNRIFDAGACGAAILSDEMEACKILFGDAIAYFDSPETFTKSANTLLNDTTGRKKRGDKLRKLISEKHTFDHRVSEILDIVKQLSNHTQIT